MTKVEPEPSHQQTPYVPQGAALAGTRAIHLLAANVRHYRSSKNISQEALAGKCGIFRTYLSRIETGKCNPSLAVLVALAGALEIPTYVLLVPMK